MAIDYVYKSTILKTDLCKRVNKLDKQRYLNSIDGIITDYDLDSQYFDLVLDYGSKAVEEASKINKARFYRAKRLETRISNMLEDGHCIFCTFNFRDEVLANTSIETRRKYITKFLKSFNCQYVANIDFGSDKEYTDRKGRKQKGTSREHYHALVCIDKLPSNAWPYGYQWLEHVRVKDNCSRKISKYISKLTNHAIKESTKRYALIYSR